MDIATTVQGGVRGLREGGVVRFRGVPYAAAPVGELRFQPPEPARRWEGLRDGTRHGPIAPQGPSRLRAAMGDFARPQDEDCLTLTIATPAADARERPVLVWLHGGAWMSGAGSLDWYDGARLAEEGNIVVVGVNYRLGALGYLHHPAVSRGNLGTADQAAALRWVRDNIAAFGGDPGRVTVMGQSAGASSIGRLMLDPAARGTFGRAILQSGSFGRAPRTLAEAAEQGAYFLRLLEIDPEASDAAARAREVPVARLLEAQAALARALAHWGETTPPFMPALDRATTQGGLIADIARAAGPAMEVMIGVTREEVHAFFAADPAMREPDAAKAAERLNGRREALAARRPGGSTMDLLADLASEETFIAPSFALADALPGPAYFYRFDYAPQGSPFRACHCIELPFVFGTLDACQGAGMLAGADAAFCATLSARMRRDWISFARYGAPEADWPRYGRGRQVMRFDSVCEAGTVG
jgi:para-nitrobenzyl esterase